MHYDHLRNTTYNDLVMGIRTENQTMIDSATNRLSVCGSCREQIGFSAGMLSEHYHRVSDKLHQSVKSLEQKKNLLQGYFRRVGNGAGNNDNQTRKSLSHDIHELGKDVKILFQLETILGSELRRRGVIVGVMIEERTNNINVTVHG